MAADAGIQQNGLWAGTSQKILRLPEGALAASTGAITDGAAFDRWLIAGRDLFAKPKVEEGFCAILVENDGTVKQYDHDMNWAVIKTPWYVLGAGATIAFGALAHGASAPEAVAIAIKYCADCHGEVQVERLNP